MRNLAKFLDSLLEYFTSPLPSNEVKDDSEGRRNHTRSFDTGPEGLELEGQQAENKA